MSKKYIFCPLMPPNSQKSNLLIPSGFYPVYIPKYMSYKTVALSASPLCIILKLTFIIYIEMISHWTYYWNVDNKINLWTSQFLFLLLKTHELVLITTFHVYYISFYRLSITNVTGEVPRSKKPKCLCWNVSIIIRNSNLVYVMKFN